MTAGPWVAAPGAWPWLVLAVLALCGLGLALYLVARRRWRRWAREGPLGPPGTLPQATARVLYRLMATLWRTEQTADVDVATTPAEAVLVADAAGRLYDALADTISVRYKGRLVPVPVKVVLPRQLFVNAVSAGFAGPGAGLPALERALAQAFVEAARRGITEERLLGYAPPLRAR